MKNNTLLFLLAFVIASQPKYLQAQVTFTTEKITLSQSAEVFSNHFDDFEIFSLDSKALSQTCHERNSSSFKIRLDLERSIEMNLEKNELRSPDYKLILADKLGGKQMPKSPCITYKGFTLDRGLVRATVTNGFMVFMIKYPNGRTFFIENANRFLTHLSSDIYVAYWADATKPLQGNFCAAFDTEKGERKLNNAKSNQNRSVAPQGCTKVRLAIASDFLMWQAHGANTEAHNLAVINNASTDFGLDFSHTIQFLVSEQFISTSSSNPAEQTWSGTTDASTLLGNYRAWSILGGFSNPFDLGQFWTKRDLNGSTVGLAYSPGICSIHKYHLLEDYTTDANSLRVLASHEIGHNWGCSHDASGSNTIMAPQISNTTNWSTASVDSLNHRNASIECNVLEGAPVARFHINGTECKNSPIQLLDLSNRNPNAWLWSMPNGTPNSSSSQHTTVQYSSTGLQTISLTSSNNQCTGTSSHTIAKTFEVIDFQGPAQNCAINLLNSSANTNYQTGIQRIELDTLISTSGSTYADGAAYLNRSCEAFVTILPGTYPITIKVGSLNTEYIDVYVDYNNDGDFDDPNELVIDNQQTTGGILSTTFTTPSSGILNDVLLRMRIMSDFNPLNSPCQTPLYGQVEDIGIIIASVPTPACALRPTGVNAFCTSSTQALIAWDAQNTSVRHRLKYRLLGSSIWNPTIVLGGYPRNYALLNGLSPDAVYEYRIRQECTNAVGSYSPIQTFATYTSNSCSKPINKEYAYRPNGDPTKIRLFCNYEPDAERYQVRWKETSATTWQRKVLIKNFYLVPNLLPSTTYLYQFRTKCAGSWTTWTPRDSFQTLPLLAPYTPNENIEFRNADIDKNKFKIYPNPFQDFLSFEANPLNPIQQIRIFNIAGQLVFDSMINAESTTLPLSFLELGLYQVQILLKDQTIINQKLVKNAF